MAGGSWPRRREVVRRRQPEARRGEPEARRGAGPAAAVREATGGTRGLLGLAATGSWRDGDGPTFRPLVLGAAVCILEAGVRKAGGVHC